MGRLAAFYEEVGGIGGTGRIHIRNCAGANSDIDAQSPFHVRFAHVVQDKEMYATSLKDATHLDYIVLLKIDNECSII